MTAALRIAIVDDEPLARRRLKRLLAGDGSVTVVGEAGDGRSAVSCLVETKPDVVLLDVQMPEQDGFAVLRDLPLPRPLVIFVTAFDEFAIHAFDEHAVDYLLKPVSRDRLAAAIGRARERLARRQDDRDASLKALLEAFEQQRARPTRLPVRLAGRVEFVDVAAIDWIEAADNYVVLHTGERTHLLRETLTCLAATLDPAAFVRVHRSAIVRVDRIARLETALRGDYVITLTKGARVPLSRSYRESLERVIGRSI